MPPYRKQLLELRENLYDADAIFETVRDQITSQYIQLLKQTKQTEERPFAFALERQSEGKIAIGDPRETGHIGRVETIQQLARDHGLYLPAPRKREHREKGEPPFLFDERFWFVDGEDERSSGFSFAPEVRPRFWFAFATLRRINELDREALPSALVLADVFRLTRADNWLTTWVDAIREEGVDLILPRYGRVTRLQLGVLAVTIQAQSEHLPQYRKRAIESARKEERILWKGCRKFGLQHSEDGKRVFAHPQEWPVIAAVIRGLADGSLSSICAAARWTRATFGEELTASEALIRTWLQRPSIIDGEHIAYDRIYQRCKTK